MKVIKLENEVEYEFDAKDIKETTTLEYRGFLREAGYADINKTPNLFVASKVLTYNQDIRNILGRHNESDGNTVVNINHTDARNLIQRLGGKVLTTQLMYGLFIPYLEQLKKQGNVEAKTTLENMQFNTRGYAEWLEDLVFNKNKVRIGSKEKKLTLSQKDGKFDRTDLNYFGYPKSVKGEGRYQYWYPRGDEIAVIRVRNSVLNLNLSGAPSFVGGGLGIRFAKFF